MFDGCRQGIECSLDLTAKQIGDHRCGTTVRDVDHFDAGPGLEQLAGYVGQRSRSERGQRDLAWIGFGRCDEFGNGLYGNSWIDLKHKRLANDGSDHRDVANKIETKVLVDC